MKKKIAFALTFVLFATALGCAVPMKEIEENTIGVELLKGRTTDINEELTRLGDKVDALYTKVADLHARMEDLVEIQEETEAIRAEIASMDAGLSSIERKLETMGAVSPTTGAVSPKGPKILKIKVLSGDGDIASAREIQRKLEAGGYPVERVDFAPYSNFSQSTVFYASGFKEDALAIARLIGGRTRTRPLTWKSVFSVIAVSGKKK